VIIISGFHCIAKKKDSENAVCLHEPRGLEEKKNPHTASKIMWVFKS
jgi:hypothetical protein